jgi:hypothetical protein
VTLFATERLPQPMVMDGVVSVDNWQRNLVVRRPESLSGYQKVAWRMAHEALVRAQEAGWPMTGARTCSRMVPGKAISPMGCLVTD